jgi:hypothetical protein
VLSRNIPMYQILEIHFLDVVMSTINLKCQPMTNGQILSFWIVSPHIHTLYRLSQYDGTIAISISGRKLGWT